MGEPRDEIRLVVEPEDGLADDPVMIQVSGLKPGEEVVLQAGMTDEKRVRWSSSARFYADTTGKVDPGRQTPHSGAYRTDDAMGLFWSMRPGGKGPHQAYGKESLTPQLVEVKVDVGGETLASRTVSRRYLGAGVRNQELEEEGLVGKVYSPAGSGPHPGILVLSGSDGGTKDEVAAILASRGYVAVALAYFNRAGLPDELIEVPVEYVGRAAAWLGAREEVDAERTGIIGKSRGGELALLAATLDDRLKAVVSQVGSGVVFEGLHKNPRDREVRSAWSYGGKPVPFVPTHSSPLFIARAIWAGVRGKPLSTLPVYLGGMEDSEAVEKAEMELEKINGPVLLVSGGRDMVWPSSELASMAMERLVTRGHAFPDEHLDYADAGHAIGLPYWPKTVNCKRVASGSMLDFGGGPQENAHASERSWNRTLEFLREHLQ